MAFSKARLYHKEAQITSVFAHAISHPARQLILQQLSKDGSSKVEELLLNHPISQPALSDHLEILRKAQLVTYKEVFPYIIYSLDGKNVTVAEQYLSAFFKSI